MIGFLAEGSGAKMAGERTDQGDNGLLGNIEDWMAQRNADVQRLGGQAMAAGRRAWAQATKAGQNLAAQQPSDVAALGARSLNPNAGISDAGVLARRAGNVAGVGRGLLHSVEGLTAAPVFEARLANPLDRWLNPPGSSASDQMINAANGIAGYIVHGITNPNSVVQDVEDAVHRLHVSVDPNASPPAVTAPAELARNFNIGMNQGELGFNIGSTLLGGVGLLKGASEIGAVVKAASPQKFLTQGFSPIQADYLAAPYTNGKGSHFFPKRGINIGQNNYKLPQSISDSPFNVLMPKGMSRGDFYELHYRVDPKAHSFRMPAWTGIKSWKGDNLGLPKYGLLGRLWFGSPGPLKAAVGGLAVAGPTAAQISADGDEQW